MEDLPVRKHPEAIQEEQDRCVLEPVYSTGGHFIVDDWWLNCKVGYHYPFADEGVQEF
jgi:hypothetical protein